MQERQDLGMNEYERRVNEAAIKAHEKRDFNEIPYKLPGIKRAGEERQDKFIERSYQKNLLA
jgi:hypothetical protein